MAHQLHVAHSETIAGAAVIAGGPYHCAGGGYPANLARALTVCMSLTDFAPFLGPPDLSRLLAETMDRAAAGAIDDPIGMEDDRVFLFSGGLDVIVPTAVVETLGRYYATFVAPGGIRQVTDVPAAHAMVTADFGNPCDVMAAPFIVDCDVDLAGALLAHLYGDLVLPDAAGETGEGRLFAFDQTAFTADAVAAGLAPEGWIFVPEGCAAAAGCRLHVAFHGCLQSAEAVGDAFVRGAGYNRWAAANAIVVLYPQAAARRRTVLGVRLPWPNPAGCWDWWGFTGEGFHLKSGRQIAAVTAMIERLTAPR